MSGLSLLRRDADAPEAGHEVGEGVVEVVRLVALPRVNLLPPEIAERRVFRRIQLGLGSAVLASVGVVALLYVAATGSVGDAQSEVDVAGALGTQLQSEQAKYADVAATYARATQAQEMLTQAMGQEVRWSRLLNDLSLTLPDNVWVKDVSFTQTALSVPAAPAVAVPAPADGAAAAPVAAPAGPLGTATFTGVGFSHDDVASWLESLATQPGYSDPSFSNSAESLIGTRKVVTFTSTTNVTADALSGRYAPKAGG